MKGGGWRVTWLSFDTTSGAASERGDRDTGRAVPAPRRTMAPDRSRTSRRVRASRERSHHPRAFIPAQCLDRATVLQAEERLDAFCPAPATACRRGSSITPPRDGYKLHMFASRICFAVTSGGTIESRGRCKVPRTVRHGHLVLFLQQAEGVQRAGTAHLDYLTPPPASPPFSRAVPRRRRPGVIFKPFRAVNGEDSSPRPRRLAPDGGVQSPSGHQPRFGGGHDSVLGDGGVLSHLARHWCWWSRSRTSPRW